MERFPSTFLVAVRSPTALMRISLGKTDRISYYLKIHPRTFHEPTNIHRCRAQTHSGPVADLHHIGYRVRVRYVRAAGSAADRGTCTGRDGAHQAGDSGVPILGRDAALYSSGGGRHL